VGVARSVQARSVVTEIVEVGAVRHRAKAEFGRLRERELVQLALAVEAAVGRVRDITWPLDLVRMHERVRRTERSGDARRVFAFTRRQARAHRRQRQGTRAELRVGDGDHERAVDAAGVANHHRFEPPHDRSQRLELGVELGVGGG
jgi:hypothetical protein